MRHALLLLPFAVSPLGAQTAGPPAPQPPARTTPAEQAIALYKARNGSAPPPAPCRAAKGDTITVCGGVVSGARVPLPEEPRIREGARTATGEMPGPPGVGGSPVAQMPNTGLRLTVGRGRKATVAGLGGS